MAPDCCAPWVIIPTVVPFHGWDQLGGGDGCSPPSFGAFQTNCITSYRRVFPPSILSLALLLSSHVLSLCSTWVSQKCIRLPVFQQSSFYEWVLKIGTSLPVLRCLHFRYSMTVMKPGVEGRSRGVDERRGSYLLAEWSSIWHDGRLSVIYTSYDNVCNKDCNRK